MKSRLLTACLVFFLAAACADTVAAAADKEWLVFEGGAGPGAGRHIVFISGDEEYRSEEGLPQLAKIAAVHHGFKCTVLFPINRKTGLIDPETSDNIPGTDALKTADLMVIATRFRALPDEQMQPIDDYLRRGGPVVGLRTATHAFNFRGDSKWKHYSNGYNGEKSAWRDGFGRLVLGEKWISHHGEHKVESARGVVAKSAASHPIARGLAETDIWGPSDVYGIRLNKLPETFEPIVLGQVIKRAGPELDDPFFGMRPTDKEVNVSKSEPAMPIAWTKMYQLPGGKQGRAFTTTMGAATDIVNEGVRRMIFNGMYWAIGLEEKIPPGGTRVDLVGEFNPTVYGFGTFNPNLRVSDLDMQPRGDGPRADVPQLKALNHFAGSWVEEVDMGGGRTAHAEGTAKWILGGTHLQSMFQIKLPGGELHHMAITTWDADAKSYVSWMFSNEGPPVFFTGVWDEDRRTFTQTSTPNAQGMTTYSVSKVTNKDRIDWTVVTRDAEGEPQMRLKGVDRRKDE